MSRWLLIALFPLAACGGDAESAPPVRPADGGIARFPWDTIAPDSLYGATAVETLRLTPVVLDVLGIPQGWDGMRIAAISDLQLDLWRDNSEVASAAIRMAAEAKPDAVVLLGDYLGSGTDASPLPRLVAPLRGIPTFAVLGDRDVRSDSLATRIAQALAAGGVHVLRNSGAMLTRRGDSAQIVGADADLLSEDMADQRWILSQLGIGRPVGLLIAHNPILAARGPARRTPTAVAGGATCARVEVPGTPRLSWYLQQGLGPALVDGQERLFRVGQMVLFVTCGTGYSFIPARFGKPPEVAMITLRSVGARPDSLVAADTAVADSAASP